MGCRILESPTDGACFYCSTTGWAFGPVFENREQAERFLEVYPDDPRQLRENLLMERFNDFCRAHVCECGEVSGEDDAEAKALMQYPDGCMCENNGDYCLYCQVKIDELEWEPTSGERFQCWHCRKQAESVLSNSTKGAIGCAGSVREKVVGFETN
jgi:hypothetical protein